MHRRPRLLSATAMALALLATSPAFAQMTPTQAWDQLQALAANMDLSITTTNVAPGPDAVTAGGVRIFPTSDPNALVISMDSLRVAPQGDQISLTPSASFDVAVLVAGGSTRHVTVTHDGSIAGMLTDQNASLDLDFPNLRAVLQPLLSAKGAPGREAFDMSFSGLDASLRAAREGAAEVTIDAGSVQYNVTYPDPSTSGAVIAQQGTMTAPHIAFTGTELDLLSDRDGMLRQAFDGGFSATLEMTTQASQGTSTQTIEGAPLSMVTEAGPSQMSLAAVNGRADLSGDVGQMTMNGNYGPIAGNVSMSGMGFNFGLPLVTTPTDQPFRYMISLQDLRPSPELLAMVGASQFAGDAVTLTVDLGAQGRLTQELGSNFGEGDVPPFDISSASLNDLRVAVGDSALTGAGAVTLIGGLLAQIGRPMPEANGDFTFDLVGGERLLTRLQGMGLIPQDQLFFVRMMMNGLARPVGDDHLQSEVAIRPGGVLTVNGAPLPF